MTILVFSLAYCSSKLARRKKQVTLNFSPRADFVPPRKGLVPIFALLGTTKAQP
jgi:hypothetical protein